MVLQPIKEKPTQLMDIKVLMLMFLVMITSHLHFATTWNSYVYLVVLQVDLMNKMLLLQNQTKTSLCGEMFGIMSP